MTETENDRHGGGDHHEEPDRVWEVTCACGYSEKFRHEPDARRVFDAHATSRDLRCGAASMEGMHAYSKGGVDPDKTLPDNGQYKDGMEVEA